MKNTFQSNEKLAWFPGKCFPEKFGRKTLSEVVKNLGGKHFLKL
jgi:hypothetical protein